MGDINYKPIIEDMTFSYSRIKSYETCPYGWRLNYIDQFTKEDKFYATYGSLMHDILEQYYGGKLTKPQLPVEFLTRFSTEVKGARPSGKIVDSYISKGLGYLRSFEEFGLNTLAVEKEITFNIEGIPMKGFIDYLGEKDGNIYLIDHKSHDLKQRSGRLKPTAKDKELDQYLRQLYLYSSWVNDTYGKFPSELWFNCFKSGEIVKDFFNPLAYEEAIKWAIDTIEMIKNDTDFDANYDYFYCRWICDQSNNCEVYEDETS